MYRLASDSWQSLQRHSLDAVQDLERQHAGEREQWRRDMQLAVQSAREEMVALTDQRLDATTQKAIIDNEAMAGECCRGSVL